MSDMITPALTAVKALLASDLDVSPAANPTAVYVYPDEYASISVGATDMPVILVTESINRTNPVDRADTVGQVSNYWEIEIAALLMRGPITTDAQAAQAAQAYRSWIVPTIDLLAANQGLSGTVTLAGVRLSRRAFSRFISWRAGAIGWAELGTFWGVHFILPVYQRITPDDWSM